MKDRIFMGSAARARGCNAWPLAEAVRFELTNGFPLPVFKTGAIDHSATLPARRFYASGRQQALALDERDHIG
jgi:hypothetical protein